MTNQGAAGHSIRRAKVILQEGEMLSEAGHWSLTHDVSPLLRQHAERSPAEFSSAIPTLASTSRALRAGSRLRTSMEGTTSWRLCKGRGSSWSAARFSFPSTRPVLRVGMGNPFAFYRVYDRAAAQLGKPAFSRAALETLGYLEDRYVR